MRKIFQKNNKKALFFILFLIFFSFLFINCASLESIPTVNICNYKTKEVWEGFLDLLTLHKNWALNAKFKIFQKESPETYTSIITLPLEKDGSLCKDDKKVTKKALTIIKIKKASLLETQIIIMAEIEELMDSPQMKNPVWKKIKSDGQVEKYLFEEIKNVLEQKRK
ncbi:MAG: hypothetical protein ABIB46_01720 [bacterium]